MSVITSRNFVANSILLSVGTIVPWLMVSQIFIWYNFIFGADITQPTWLDNYLLCKEYAELLTLWQEETSPLIHFLSEDLNMLEMLIYKMREKKRCHLYIWQNKFSTRTENIIQNILKFWNNIFQSKQHYIPLIVSNGIIYIVLYIVTIFLVHLYLPVSRFKTILKILMLYKYDLKDLFRNWISNPLFENSKNSKEYLDDYSRSKRNRMWRDHPKTSPTRDRSSRSTRLRVLPSYNMLGRFFSGWIF